MNKLKDINLVARYIALSLLTKQMTVSPLKLQKLLYYSQAWSMVLYPLFFDPFHEITK